MKKIISSLLAIAGMIILSNCETTEDRDHDHHHNHHHGTTTTTTEETTIRPLSGSVQTQTVRSY